jgi:four helix bundle protein
VESLSKTKAAEVIGRQLLRSPSIGASCQPSSRGKSTADVLAKVAIVEEEAGETTYWLELLIESGVVDGNRAAELLKETNEITAMIVASIKTLRARL